MNGYWALVTFNQMPRWRRLKALDSSEFKPGGMIQLDAPLTKLDDSGLEQPAKTPQPLSGESIKAMLADCPLEALQEIYKWLHNVYGCRIYSE